MKRAFALSVVLAAVAAAEAWAGSRVPGDYVFTGDIDLGGPGFWDYATLDSEQGRLYVSHVDKVSVVDLASRKVVGSVGPLSQSHGIAIVDSLHKGYATSGGDGQLDVFDLADFHILTQIKVGEDADGVIFDPQSNTVIVMVGDAKQVAIVDPRSDSVVSTVDLPDVPEFGAFDARGKLYVNLVKTAQLAKIDIANGRVDAVWPLAGCKSPHGLAYDPRIDRLFSGCSNKTLVVVEPGSGKIIAQVTTGAYSDGVGLDAGRHRVFSSNGDGTLTVIHEDANDGYSVERTIPTFLGGRTIAVDPQTGELFIPHGDTHIKGERTSPLDLRFGWDNAEVATFLPND